MISARLVLAQLTKSGIWSSWSPNPFQATQHNQLPKRTKKRHVVLDAESIVAFLYRQCALVGHHHKSERSPSQARSKSSSDGGVHATPKSPVKNYQEFASLVEKLFSYLINKLNLTPIVVYSGLPSKWDGPRERHSAEALNIFKQIATSANYSKFLMTHQALYSAFPSMTRLARDHKCSVLTNEGDFILMDVRAGFILFEDFYKAHLAPEELRDDTHSLGGSLARFPSTSSVSSNASTVSSASMANQQQQRQISPKSPLGSSSKSSVLLSPKSKTNQRGHRSPALSLSRSSPRSAGSSNRASPVGGGQVQAIGDGIVKPLRVHQHKLFLRQHPGLNSALALHLFPLTSNDFLTTYAKSLVRIHLFDSGNLIETRTTSTKINNDNQNNTTTRGYHRAAARLEAVLRFLCARTAEILPGLIRSEASRVDSSRIEQDYRELHEHHAVAHELRGHLKTLSKQQQQQLK